MSVLGVISRQDRGTGVLPNLQAPPESTGFFQNVSAGFNQAVAGPHSTQNARAIYESRNYDQIIQALKAEGEKATDMVDIGVKANSPLYTPQPGNQVGPNGNVLVPHPRDFTNPFSEGPSLTRDVNPITNLYLGGDAAEIKNIWAAVQKVRARKPGFLKDFPDENAVSAAALKQRQADEATAGAVTSRATTLGKVGSFIGGVGGSLASGDPENLVGGFSGAAGKSFARSVINHAVSGAVANAAAGTVALPGQAADAERLGQPMTTGDMVRSVAENAAAGSLLGTVHATVPAIPHAVGTVAGKVFDTVAPHIPDAIRDPVVAASIRAGTVKDRQLLYEFQRQHNPWTVSDTSTPTEKAAAHVIATDVETQEQSPLHPEAAGTNSDRLGAVAKALGVDLTPPDMPTTAPTQTATVRDQSAGAPAPRKMSNYATAIIGSEGSTRNPRSTADGYGNFTEGTWLAIAPRVFATEGMSKAQILSMRGNRDIAERAIALYGQDNGKYLRARGLEDSPGNLSLAHFIGPEGAAELLKADPSTPVESILPAKVIEANHEVLRGKSADQVIAWAHKRIGAAVDHPPARPDAVPDEGYDYSSPAPYTVETLRPEAITTDAAAMQYKSGGDEQGVTGILADQTAYNRLISHDLLIYRREDGTNVLVDGHQRLGLARRINDPALKLPSLVIHEADGITPEQARTLGALRNIANGTGSLIDNAKVLRDAPSAASLLPRNVPLARDSMGLAHLSYEAFGAAVNEVVPPEIAAQVGLNAPHNPEAHLPILSLLAKEKVTDPKEAAAITRQALADGFGTAHSEQLSMLGAEPQQSLYRPIARIMAAAAKKLRDEKRTFKVLTDKSSKIESVGNVLDKTANASKVIGNDEALAILDRTAHRAGPVRDALIAAARAELSGARRGDAVNQFLDQLGGIDLRAAAAGVGSDGQPREPLGGAGRDLAAEAPDADVSRGSEPSLFEVAVAARDGAEKFSDPVSPEAKEQADLIEHDLRQDAGRQSGDTRGQGVFYHGARGEVLKLTEGYYNPDNIYGGMDTFYTTDALDVAKGYGRKRPSARTYQVRERAPVHFFNMEDRLPVSHWNELFHLKEDDEGLVPVAIEEAGYEAGGNDPNLREIMDEIRHFSYGEGYSKDDVQELFDAAIYNLKESGFGGMTHTGGLLTGRKAHTVRIYFDAQNQLELHDVTPEQKPTSEGVGAQGDTQQSPSAATAEGQGQGGTGTPDAAVEAPVHLFDLPETGFRLSEEGNAVSIKEALDSADADEAAAKALRDCL